MEIIIFWSSLNSKSFRQFFDSFYTLNLLKTSPVEDFLKVPFPPSTKGTGDIEIVSSIIVFGFCIKCLPSSNTRFQ